MTHILLSPYRKTIARNQVLISNDLHESFYYIPLDLSLWDQIHILSKLPLLIRRSPTNLSEEREHKYFFKIFISQNNISEASEDISTKFY